ncbi:YczE/YyaS/YitT family protein [Clostridium cadaveris]|uniref:YczE/YyaS/YitT family protein n=1 Tax=Clostridium cadaveris TaxID=1529 RepID=UPI0039A2D4FD
MKEKLVIFARLIFGFILCSSSTVFMLNSNLGLSPWDVFHQGLSILTGITIGQASILIGILFVFLGMLFGQKLGFGTILNMILIGQFIDIIIYIDIIPKASSVFMGIIMMIIGMLIMGFGCYFYMGCGLGCGPRDGVMVALSIKLNKPIKYVRSSMEVMVLIIGYFLGGKVGMGTFISALFLGYSLQTVFKFRNFNPEEVNHKSIVESLGFFK